MAKPPLRPWPPLPPTAYLRSRTHPLPFPLDEPWCLLYAQARTALAAGLVALGVGPGARILMPAWHHGSEVEAVLHTGAKCLFYDVGPDLAPDEETLESLLGPDVVGLHLTHYLGFPQDAPRWRRWCDEHGLLLVEDAAQAWLASHGGVPVGSHGDLAVWCLYKTVGVPDGAAVRCVRPLPEPRSIGRGTGITLRRHAAWFAQLVPEPQNRGIGDAEYDAATDMALVEPFGATAATHWLAPRLGTAETVGRRRDNYERWLQVLRPVTLSPFEHLPCGAVPMVFPVAVDDKPAALAEIGSAGIHGLDLWRQPHPSSSTGDHPRADWLREHMLGLPLHQELRRRRLDAAIRDVAGILLSRGCSNWPGP